MYELLVSLKANPEIVDIHAHKAIYYMSHPEELDIEGPARSISRGKRRRKSPISPPKRKLTMRKKKETFQKPKQLKPKFPSISHIIGIT
jgi:hypothetical protein